MIIIIIIINNTTTKKKQRTDSQNKNAERCFYIWKRKRKCFTFFSLYKHTE